MNLSQYKNKKIQTFFLFFLHFIITSSALTHAQFSTSPQEDKESVPDDIIALFDSIDNSSSFNKIFLYINESRGKNAHLGPILKRNIDSNKDSANKFLLLNRLYGIYSFNQSSDTESDGFEAYNNIFDYALKNHIKQNAVIDFSLNEYVNLVQHRFASLSLQQDQRTRETLFKAWDVYIHLDHTSPLPEPNFATAFQAIGNKKDVQSLVLQALADPNIHRSFTLLVSGASAIQETQPKQAITWLIEAKNFLPKRLRRSDAGDVVMALDINAAARYYDQIVDLFESQKQSVEAISYEQERVDKTGGGYGRLWVLLGKVGDTARQKTVFNQLKAPSVKAREVLRAAGIMVKDAQSQDKEMDRRVQSVTPQLTVQQKQVFIAVVEILQTLLTTKRVLEVDEQIEARIMLGLSLWRIGQIPEANAATRMDKPEWLSPRQQNLWNELLRLRVSIAKETEQNTTVSLDAKP